MNKNTNNKAINKLSKLVVNAAVPGIDIPSSLCPLFFGKPKSSHKLTSANYKELSAFMKNR